jgi:DNA modification methylase
MEPVRIGDATLYTGDVLAVLAELPDESVHCVVTSPPYWGLRDYGSPGQLGIEKTPEEYIARMVEVFREVRRVLRKDGTAWVNMGDSYISNPGDRAKVGGFQGRATKERIAAESSTSMNRHGCGLKPKDLCMMPARLALALQADGWYLRSDIIWSKPNPMPESVTDRPTKAHEYIFLLAKSAHYFYDAEAIREEGGSWSKMPYGWDTGEGAHGSIHRNGREKGRKSGNKERRPGEDTIPGASHVGRGFPWEGSTRNRRTVWTSATEAFPGSHFATFPRKLVQPCILAGCPEHVCPKCGAPWVREKEPTPEYAEMLKKTGESWYQRKDDPFAGTGKKAGEKFRGINAEYLITGEHPTCTCGLPAIGGTILDPFGGSGTTAEVALEYGRRAILIELKPEYVDLQRRRLAPVAGRPLLNFAGGQA